MIKIRKVKEGLISLNDYLHFLRKRKVLTLKREKELTHILLEKVFARLLSDSKKKQCSFFCLIRNPFCVFVEKYFFEIEVYRALTSEEHDSIREDGESSYVSAHVSSLSFGDYIPNRHLEHDDFFEHCDYLLNYLMPKTKV